MNKEGLTSEYVDRLERLGSKLENIEGSAAYSQIVQSIIQVQKDNFEMLDRSLTMMQAVHEAELKNNAFYVDIVKFLIPIFATSAVTGAAVTSPNINSSLLVVIGLIGAIASLFMLIPFIVQRYKKMKRQNDEYDKLARAFSDWQKIVDIQRTAANENSSALDWRNILETMQELIPPQEMDKTVGNEGDKT